MLPLAQLETAIGTEELPDGVREQRGLACPDQEFGAAAGAQDSDFIYTFRTSELAQDLVPAVLADPKKRSLMARGAVR